MFSVDLISLLDNIHSCNFKETNNMDVFSIENISFLP